MSDTGNIDAFIQLYGDTTRYTVERGFLHWNDKYWEVDKPVRKHSAGKWMFLKARAMAYFFENNYPLRFDNEDLRKAWRNWGVKSGNAARLDALLDYVRMQPPIICDDAVFESTPYLLNVQNGTIDVREGTLRKHRKEDYLT
jgi:putative DNA primase/helicase